MVKQCFPPGRGEVSSVNCFKLFFQDVGYNHGKTMFSSWERGGLISKLFQDKKREERKLNRQSQDVDKLVSI